jgi:hypothetical protein
MSSIGPPTHDLSPSGVQRAAKVRRHYWAATHRRSHPRGRGATMTTIDASNPSAHFFARLDGLVRRNDRAALPLYAAYGFSKPTDQLTEDHNRQKGNFGASMRQVATHLSTDSQPADAVARWPWPDPWGAAPSCRRVACSGAGLVLAGQRGDQSLDELLL